MPASPGKRGSLRWTGLGTELMRVLSDSSAVPLHNLWTRHTHFSFNQELSCPTFQLQLTWYKMKLAQYITMIGNSSVSSRLFLPTKCQGTLLPRMTYSKVADPDFIRSGVIGRHAHGLMCATFAKLTTSARGKPPAQGSRPPEQSRTFKALCSLCALHLIKPKVVLEIKVN